MSELFLQYWWAMFVTIPLLAFIIYTLANGFRKQSASYFPDTRLQFALVSMLCIFTITDMLSHDGKWKIIFTCFACMCVFLLVGIHFFQYNACHKIITGRGNKET